jgi:hypothetical protein
MDFMKRLVPFDYAPPRYKGLTGRTISLLVLGAVLLAALLVFLPKWLA